MGEIKARNGERQSADAAGHMPLAVFLSRREKGGTEELHSRSGRAGFIRPCRDEALSGRRAAQDGCGRVLGGPERAGAKRSGEALSAGRAAAPGQLQVETLGRGRSDDRVAHVLAERAKSAELVGPVEARPCERAGAPFQAMAGAVVLAVAAVLLAGPAVAQNFVKPGDTNSIEIPVENFAGSMVPLKGVRVDVEAPAHFIIKATSIKGPVNILPGAAEEKIFKIDFEIAANAPEGAFEVSLKVRMDSTGTEPAPTTLDTLVLFTSNPVPFSLDRLG